VNYPSPKQDDGTGDSRLPPFPGWRLGDPLPVRGLHQLAKHGLEPTSVGAAGLR
jgi:hypothetical protein